MNIHVKVDGLDDLMKKFSLAGLKAQGNADKVTETYTRKMANEAGAAAPVLDNLLRPNLIASPRRIGPALWEFGGTLEYTRIQEYEHATKKGFIRKAVWNNRQDYRERLAKEVAQWK